MRIRTSPEVPIRISPQANVLPANTLRFYIHFPRSAEAHFDRDQLWLLNKEEQAVRDGPDRARKDQTRSRGGPISRTGARRRTDLQPCRHGARAHSAPYLPR